MSHVNLECAATSRWTGWWFALPGLLLLALVLGYPLLYGITLAFSSFTLLHPRLEPLVGLVNILRVSSNPLFWHAAGLTVFYSFVTVAAELALGLFIALMIHSVRHLQTFYFAVLTIPLAMSPVSVGLVWHMLLQPNLGITNHLLTTLTGAGVDWLGSPRMAFWTVVFVDIWQQVSFVTLILTAGLAALPVEPFEAAQLDGANAWQRFRHLTLPMLKPVAAIAAIIQLINELRTYDLVYVLTKGGPGIATEVLSYYAYKLAFRGLGINDAAAVSLALLALAFLLTIAFSIAVSQQKSL